MDEWNDGNNSGGTSLVKQFANNNLDDEEVLESWEDFEPEPEPEPQTSAVPKETKKVDKKSKMKDKLVEPDVEDRKLTPQEIEELQRKSDMQLTKEALGIDDEQEENNSHFSAQTFDPVSKEEFKAYADHLIAQLNRHQKKKEYPDFLSELFKSLCLELDSEHVKKFGRELTFLGTEMHKREKEAEKKQQKSSKKPIIAKGRGDLLDDIDVERGGYYGGDNDDDDFM